MCYGSEVVLCCFVLRCIGLGWVELRRIGLGWVELRRIGLGRVA